METTQQSLAAPVPLVPSPAVVNSTLHFSALPPSYNFDNIVSNSYHLDSVGMPNALVQMAFNQLFIRLSMLTSATMDRIRYNWNLKCHKLIFGNGAGKYPLDESSFPDELALNECEFWQVYRNWLFIIDVIADTRVADSWKAHRFKMIMDTSFPTWFQAWREDFSERNLC